MTITYKCHENDDNFIPLVQQLQHISYPHSVKYIYKMKDLKMSLKGIFIIDLFTFSAMLLLNENIAAMIMAISSHATSTCIRLVHKRILRHKNCTCECECQMRRYCLLSKEEIQVTSLHIGVCKTLCDICTYFFCFARSGMYIETRVLFFSQR